MNQITSTRQQIIKQTGYDSTINAINPNAWLLLGTEGCHLCDTAEDMLRLFAATYPVSIEKVDIADFNEPLMLQFATVIPTVITLTKQVNYPFSLPDLYAAYQNDVAAH